VSYATMPFYNPLFSNVLLMKHTVIIWKIALCWN